MDPNPNNFEQEALQHLDAALKPDASTPGWEIDRDLRAAMVLSNLALGEEIRRFRELMGNSVT